MVECHKQMKKQRSSVASFQHDHCAVLNCSSTSEFVIVIMAYQFGKYEIGFEYPQVQLSLIKKNVTLYFTCAGADTSKVSGNGVTSQSQNQVRYSCFCISSMSGEQGVVILGLLPLIWY